ncbi:DUF397 domain-containing protein [Streptomyces sp. NPDC050528]|uniref:DUF397 domain-containing protein n=1 Tax=unclassified Streptomyces TaxID=2593676 RepID=UPI0037BD5E0E
MEAARRRTTWRRSSHSGSSGGDCVEVAAPAPAAARSLRIAIRDSKTAPGGAVVTVHRARFADFINSLSM